MATTQSVADIMTTNPIVLDADAPLADTARAMRDSDIGDMIVLDEGAVCGIATDRAIVVRASAAGKDPATTPFGDVCTRDLTTLAPESPVDDAVRLIREKALRRLPVLEGDRSVGVVVPTGFEPVSHLESVLGVNLATCGDARIRFLTCRVDTPAVLVIS